MTLWVDLGSNETQLSGSETVCAELLRIERTGGKGRR